MDISYEVNNIYLNNNMDEKINLFNEILSKIIYILENIEDDYII